MLACLSLVRIGTASHCPYPHFCAMLKPFLQQKGGYRKLRAYKVATIIYDATYYFVSHFLNGRDHTTDQMVQAARSGKPLLLPKLK